MASESVDADEPRERPKWGENYKVYTRRNRTKAPDDKTNAQYVAVSASANTHASVENRINDIVDVAVTTASATVGNNNSEKVINEESDTFPQWSPKILATEEANSFQQEQAPPASNEISVQDKLTAPNGSVRANGNGESKAIVTKVENRIRVNLKSGRPKNEIRELKRKLANELNQVRSVVSRLEDEEVMLSGRSTASGAGGYGVHSQYQMNDGRALMRVYSDVGSVAQHDSRPFRPLSVSIMENNNGFGDLSDREKSTPKANQDRLPAEVSNTSWKPYGGKKQGRQAGHRFSAHKYISKSFKGSSDLLTRLMKHKHSWLFNKPVDVEALKLHDYHNIIKNPMDLGTIKIKLTKRLYKSPVEFAEDVKLTLNNAMTYNPKGHEVHGMAEELLKIFEAKWPAIESDYNLALKYEKVQDMGLPTPTSRSYEMGLPTPTSRLHDMGLPTPTSRSYEMGLPTPTSRLRDMGLPTPTSRLRDMGLPTPTSRLSDFRNVEMPLSPFDPKVKLSGGSGRTPALKKPKAKDLHKRDMTYDEKQKLSANLQSLPSEKLVDIVHIIKKRNSSVSQHDDEIEVDIDSFDAETLWELDRFVSNFKKNLSKKKRRAEIALKARSVDNPLVSTISPAPTTTKSLAHSKIGEKSIAIPSSDQGEREGDGAGRSSSSSSSSSDSGSSSSDSDSDSSSSNGSEGAGSPKT